MHLLPHLAARVLGTPLLIHPQKLDVILSALSARIGIALPAAPLAGFADMTQSASAGEPYQVERIAVIPVTGSLVNRALGLDAMSGLTSYGDLCRALDSALANPAVDSIVLDIDSPGGEAGGAFDLADRIFAARPVKPIWAVANDQAFSAAYAIASSCERVFVTRTGGVGSIGVIAMHVDQSQKDAQDGYRYTPVHAGQRKNDFSPHAPLSPDAQSALQTEVDRLYALFATTIARNRALSEDAVRATEAGLYFGDSAFAAGLADGVGTLDDALRQMAEGIATRRAAAQAGKRQLVSSSPLSFTTSQESPSMDNPTPALPDTGAAPTPSSVNPAAAASNHAAAQALAIADLCLLAGMPERTADLLKRGVDLDDARRELLAAKAAAGGEEIHSRLAPAASSAAPASLDHNPVVQAARARAAAMHAAA